MRRTVMFKLGAILMGIVVTLLLFSIYLSYRLVVSWGEEHLREMVQSQARLIEESFRSDREYLQSIGMSEKEAFEHTLKQLRNAHDKYEGFGKTGELTLAMEEDGHIHFLLSHRHDKVKSDKKVIPYQKGIAEPMQLALEGKSGTIVGGDYRGTEVIAAYEPLHAYIPMGIVAKMDASEVQHAFLNAGLMVLLFSFFLVLVGVGMIFRVTDPLMRRLKKSETYYETLLNMIPEIVTEVNPKKQILWTNSAGRRFYGKDVVGKEAREFFVGEQYTYEQIEPLITGEKEAVAVKNLQRRQDGEVRLLAWQCNAIKNEHGEVTSILSTARDITESNMAYEKIEKLNRLLQLISNCNQIVVRAQEEDWLLREVVKLFHEEGTYQNALFIKDKKGQLDIMTGAGDYNEDQIREYLALPESEQDSFPVKRVLRTFEASIEVQVESAILKHFCSKEKDDMPRSLGIFPMVLGRYAGVLVLCSEKRDVFDEVEVGMINELVGDMEYGMAAIENARQYKESKERLEMAHRRYKVSAEVSRTGAWEVWPEEWRVQCDDGYKRLIGYEPEELGDDFDEWLAIMHPEDRVKAEMVIGKMKAGGYDRQSVEIRFKQKDGSYRWFLVSGSRIDLDDTLWHIYGATTDINDQIRAYDELARKNEQFYNTIEHAPIPIMLHAEDGKVLRINHAWTDLTGYSKAMIPTIDAWTQKAYGKEAKRVKQGIAEIFQSSGPVSEGQFRITTHDRKKLIWYFTSAVIGKLSDGKKIAISTALDMTELNQKEEQMIAQSRQAAMGDMIAMIAHQWRQPITVIAMAANNVKLDLELEGRVSEQKIEQMIETVTDQTQHLSKTIDDFRNFFKPNKEKESVSIGTVVAGAMRIIGKSLENNNIAVTVLDESKQQIETYPNELLQVLLNIIGNAKDAFKMEEGQENAAIKVLCRDEGETVLLEICDNAGGIAEEAMSRIGQPYFTTKKVSGTGLGIYMSKTIVEKHLFGTINWFNRGGGACFSIQLPLAFDKGVS